MYINSLTLAIVFISLFYLLWASYKNSPKRIIKSLWDDVQKTLKKIYHANESKDFKLVTDLEKQNKEKTFIINTLLNYYFNKRSEYYHHNFDTDNSSIKPE